MKHHTAGDNASPPPLRSKRTARPAALAPGQQGSSVFQRMRLQDRFTVLGPIGAYIYIVGFAIPGTGSIPLITLVVTSILVAAFGTRDEHAPVALVSLAPVALFLSATAMSILFSDDVSRSLWLSASFLPATLLFLVIAECFQGTKDIHRLYCSFSVAGLCLSLLLLWSAWNNTGTDYNAWVAYSGSPILITRNDLTYLSVIAPFSLVLVHREPRSMAGVTGMVSVICSVAAIVIFQSRGATLALLVAVFCSATLLRSRLSVAASLLIIFAALVMDGIPGFPLMGRFMDLLSQPSAGRSGHWATAWTMFLDAPLFGHGPQTFALFHPHPWTHNLYLQVLAEQGIIGFIALLFALVLGLSTAWKTRFAVCDDIRNFGAAAFGSLLGFCLSSVVELSFLRHWVVVVLFVLLGVIARLASLQITGNGEGTNDKKNIRKH